MHPFAFFLSWKAELLPCSKKMHPFPIVVGFLKWLPTEMPISNDGAQSAGTKLGLLIVLGHLVMSHASGNQFAMVWALIMVV